MKKRFRTIVHSRVLRLILWACLWLFAANVMSEMTGLYPWQPYVEPNVAAKLTLLRHDFRDVDILFVGSSKAARGFDPSAVEKELKQFLPNRPVRAFTLGIPAGAVYNSAAMLQSVLHRARPEVIVLGVGAGEFNSKAMFALEPYVLNYAPPSQLLKQSAQGFPSFEVLRLRIRGIWRPSGLPFQWLLRYESNYRKQLVEKRRYAGQRRRSDPFRGDIRKNARQIRWRALVPYQIEGYADEAFHDIINLTSRRGIRLIVVIMPISTTAAPILYQKGEDELLRNYLARVCEKHNIPLFDLNRPPFKPAEEDFLNANHLNIEGAKKISRKIARRILAPILYPTSTNKTPRKR